MGLSIVFTYAQEVSYRAVESASYRGSSSEESNDSIAQLGRQFSIVRGFGYLCLNKKPGIHWRAFRISRCGVRRFSGAEDAF